MPIAGHWPLRSSGFDGALGLHLLKAKEGQHPGERAMLNSLQKGYETRCEHRNSPRIYGSVNGGRHYIRSVKGMELTNGRWGSKPFECGQGSPNLSLSADVQQAINRCREYLEAKLNADADAAIYGVNTGFGDLASTRVGAEALSQLQRNLLVSHACGVEAVPEDVVRAMVLLKIKSLGKGWRVRLETVQRLVDHWNANLLPLVPSQAPRCKRRPRSIESHGVALDW